MSNSLKQRTWKAFRFEDIFEINTGANVPKSSLNAGTIPRITATDSNNGVDFFTGECSNRNFRTYANCVSISFLGSCFYQPYLASYDMKIHNIKIKGREFNKYIALFLANQCKRTCTQVTYGNQMSSSDLKRQNIFLPVTTDGNPDYAYMEAYMKEVEKRLLTRYKAFLDNKNSKTPTGGGKSLKIKWKAFVLNDFFEIKATNSSIDRNRLNGIKGDIPYITRTNKNNGWDSLIAKQTQYGIDKGNVITIGLDSQTAFYQPIAFYTGQNIQIITNKSVNKYVASFIIPLLKKQMEKFNWGGNGATLGRLHRLKIMLPVDIDGNPDYTYMETFMMEKEASVLNRYITSRLAQT